MDYNWKLEITKLPGDDGRYDITAKNISISELFDMLKADAGGELSGLGTLINGLLPLASSLLGIDIGKFADLFEGLVDQIK